MSPGRWTLDKQALTGAPRNSQKTDGIISDLTDKTLPFPAVCFAVRSKERLLLSISVVPQRCGHIGTSEHCRQQQCRRRRRQAARGCASFSNLSTSCSQQPSELSSVRGSRHHWTAAHTRVKHYEAVWFHVNTLCFLSAMTGLHQTGSGDLWLPHFLCKCSDSRRTEMLKSVCLVISCCICNVHFC